MAGCAITTHPYGFDVGVELEPLAPGWHDNLSMKPYATPGQFVWREGPFSIEIADWVCNEPTYFMVYVRNRGDDGGTLRIRRWSADDPMPGTNARESLTRGEFHENPPLTEGEEVEVPAGRTVPLWIDRLPWLANPSIGDRLGYDFEIESGGAVVKCPVAFRVARVFRRR